MSRAIVYVDGFNLFYGLYKNRRNPLPRHLRWLDVGALCIRLLPNDRVVGVRYFTADVSASRSDPEKPVRQQAFLKALTLQNPNLEIHKGKFQPTTKKGIPVDQTRFGSAVIEIHTFEEKGSDVNIAAHLLRDAFHRDCEKAVVISNDSDLVEPLRIARDELGVHVAVLSPYPWVTNDLKAASSSNGVVDAKLVRICQLPDALSDRAGNVIVRPRKWTLPRPSAN